LKLKTQIPIFYSIFWWLRQVLGDAAYENYLRSAGCSTPLMTREEFFLDSLRRRYSTISRCC
jgi:uncharacterized short protein YbdD (DUF466 family)